MSPDRLGTALRDLVDDVEQGVAPPVAGALWAGGRRRRRTARLVPVLAAACVAALVALVVWPSGAPRASVPAVTIDGDGYARLTSYPSAIPKPPFIPASPAPGSRRRSWPTAATRSSCTPCRRPGRSPTSRCPR